jgi:type IV secretory pathway VirB10-like protein
MSATRTYQILLAALMLTALCCATATAEQLRYMDEAGNIRFVHRMNQVPRQYREQIVPPTPTPVLDHRQKMELKRRQQEEELRRRRQEQARQMDEQRRRQLAERQRLQYERERYERSGYNQIHRGGR